MTGADGRWNRRLEHPENDLTEALDYPNRMPPEPQSFDDLADAPDPAVQYELNRKSSRQAVWWCIGTVVASLIASFMLALAFRLIGGSECTRGEATWLCTRTAEIWWPLGSSVIPALGVVGCSIIMLSKLRRYLRWSPWMGVFWVLVPHAMAWMVGLWPIAISGN